MYTTKSKFGKYDNSSNGVNSNYKNSEAINHDLDTITFTETEFSYHYEFEIPGYIKEDFYFYINSSDDLVVTTEKSKTKAVTQTSAGKITKHSYCYASAYFKRKFQLPRNVVRDEISVDYKDEILSFDLFKKNQ